MKKAILAISVMGGILMVGTGSAQASSCIGSTEGMCISFPTPTPTPDPQPEPEPNPGTGTGVEPEIPVEDNLEEVDNGTVTPPAVPDSDSGSSDVGSPDPVEPPPATPDSDSAGTGEESLGGAPDTNTDTSADESTSESSDASGEVIPPASPDSDSAPAEAVVPQPVVQPVAQPVVQPVAQPVVVATATHHPAFATLSNSHGPITSVVEAPVQMETSIAAPAEDVTVNAGFLKLALAFPLLLAVAAIAGSRAKNIIGSLMDSDSNDDAPSIDAFETFSYDLDSELVQLIEEESSIRV